MNPYDEIKRGEKGAWVSISAYLVLSALKLIAGYWFASGALVADGYNNLTDIVASLAVLIGLRISQKPPDKDHRYGHFRAETIAALIASFIMAMVGIQVLISTIQKLIAGNEETPNVLSAVVALFSAVCMGGVYIYNSRLAKRIQNAALQAAAKDNLSDALVSIGAAIGIFGSQLGLPWLDPVAALFVGAIICKTAWEIFYSSTHALTDGFDESELMTLRQTIVDTNGVKLIKDMKARVHGSQVLLDVIVQVDPMLTLVESHTISDEIERRMKQKHNIMSVHVHVEPLAAADTNAARPAGK
ncbi:cation diffusion facilitator family transporter [Paenibacillus protaetiae]|uniref:Cation transporter n=1 Tax=Paenibacillus protaetiae TaxID=2509456 RepID=A0A4P6EYH1_9BACL|nr:cation diffusion facilitator family transporter [Paenibacillus protaetiae]QAY68134.1 cation transporter [Paenibacillus protaetiae]